MRDMGLAGESPAESDQTAKLVDALRNALARARPIRIVGAGSKPWSAGHLDGERLSLAGHVGIIDYHPEELVLQARSGTPLDVLSAFLAHHRQALPWEPPRFGGQGTLGGAVASGLAGPGRPWQGAVRDAVLGVEMLNGKGERLVFGGQVMKNVAGYDLSRLQAGAQGALGLLLSASVRLMPLPEAEATCILECDRAASQNLVRNWARLPWPVSATCFLDGRLHVRLSGAQSSVAEAARKIGGERTDAASIWPQLRDRELPCFQVPEGATLWQIHCPPAADWPPEDCVVEWAGARRWWSTNLSARKVCAGARAIAAAAWPANHPPAWDGSLAARLKRAFDPRNLLNPGLTQPGA